jgi:hypothetical protein
MQQQPNPYSAPVAADPPPMTGGMFGEAYTSQAGKAKVITILVILFALTHIAAIGSNLLELEFLERATTGNVTELEGEANDQRQLLVFAGTFGAFIACAVAIGMFLHRANKNARALAGEGVPLEYTPGWTVGWFFVPLLNLWKPYRAVGEMFTVSRPTGTGMLGVWWAAWIAMNVVGRVSQRYSTSAEAIDEFVTANHIDSAHSLVSILAALTVLWVVRTLHRLQEQHAGTGRPDMP